jgi:lipoyl(octanoyl) transferase
MEIVQLPGLMPYAEAWELQRVTHDAVVAGERASVIYLLEHSPIYTAGRRTHTDEFPTNGTEVLPVDRGGKITWHGPGQLVAYPIIKLREPIDVIEFLRRLESAVIEVCADYGLAAQRVEGRTGVWLPAAPAVEEQPGASKPGVAAKVCAIGARVARNVTMHGLALNCNPDLTAFDAIVPCGIDDAAVTSLTKAIGKLVTVEEVRPILAEALVNNLTPQLAQHN